MGLPLWSLAKLCKELNRSTVASSVSLGICSPFPLKIRLILDQSSKNKKKGKKKPASPLLSVGHLSFELPSLHDEWFIMSPHPLEAASKA